MMKALAFDGGRLHAVDFGGDGPPALLVHGMGAHTGWWRWSAPRLSARHRVVALDLSGHGDSAWREPPAYGLGAFAEDIEAARSALGWERFYLIGHSLGARVSLHYAHRYGRRLDRLAALDFLTEVPPSARGRFERRAHRRQPSYASAEALAARFHLQPPGTTAPADMLAALAAQSGRRRDDGRWTWKFDWRAFRLQYLPIWPELSGLAAPLLVLRGSASAVMRRESFARVLAACPGAAGVEILGAHHHLPLDAPVPTADALLAFGRKKFARLP